MKLLLDELYSFEIARRLREKGHDVICATEDPELVGTTDRKLIDAALAQQRVIMTNNVADFIPLASSGIEHYGLLFTSDQTLPRARNTIGRYVRALDRYLQGRRADDALRRGWEWLKP